MLHTGLSRSRCAYQAAATQQMLITSLIFDGVADQSRRGLWAHNLKKIWGCNVCTAKPEVVMATVLATRTASEVIGESPLI